MPMGEVFCRLRYMHDQGECSVSQRTHSLRSHTLSLCSRCGTVTAHVHGQCRACDPCTAAILAEAMMPYDHVGEEHRQSSERATAVMARPAVSTVS